MKVDALPLKGRAMVKEERFNAQFRNENNAVSVAQPEGDGQNRY
jgi:hypothetical protein